MLFFLPRLACLLLGYGFGLFLTAELCARVAAHKSAAALGTGNPGMANITATLGLRAGLWVLAGDSAKAFAAVFVCRALFPALGAAGFYAALGAAAGHCFPAWKGFRGGGLGVAVTGAALLALGGAQGLAANLAGLAAVLCTGWLPLGAVILPLAFCPAAFRRFGTESGLVWAVLTALLLFLHAPGLSRIAHGTETRVKLFGKRRRQK